MTLETGYLLNNRYRILEVLGQGGMAAVYRALDENLGLEVAVKENLFTTEEYARQFRREATILASLRHPNLPRVTDHFVIPDQGQYLVMDFIEGEDLRQRMARVGPLPEDQVVKLGMALCEALAYMHEHEPPVFHRDIKPGNVKITPTGEIFLVDFGLAKMAQPSQVTTTGARAMTPGYSPPEQYGTGRTDGRSDIYSLGATLYAALTGAIPEDALARAMEQAKLTPIRARRPTVSRRLAAAIEKALEVQPDDRWQTASDFRAALLRASGAATRRQIEQGPYTLPPPPDIPVAEEAESAEEAPAPPASDPNAGTVPPAAVTPPVALHRGGCLWALLGSFFTLAVVVALFAWTIVQGQVLLPAWLQNWLPLPSPTPTVTPVAIVNVVASPTVALPSATPTATPEPTSTATPTATITPSPTNTPTATPTPSPTLVGGGRAQLAFASTRAGVYPQVFLMGLDGSGLRKLTAMTGGACQPAWSPDGEALVFIAPCPDEQNLYQGARLYLIRADGTGLEPLTSDQDGGLGDFDPAWSPDGRYIAFTRLEVNGRQVYLLDLSTGQQMKVSDGKGQDYQPGWDPTGRWLMYVGARGSFVYLFRQPLQDRSPQPFANLRYDDVFSPQWLVDDQALVIWIPDGGSLRDARVKRITVNEQGMEVQSVVSEETPMRNLTLSPDRLWALVEAWPDGQNHDIYQVDLSSGEMLRLTSDPALDFDPAWRP